MYFWYFNWTLQWKHSRWSDKMGIFWIQYYKVHHHLFEKASKKQKIVDLESKLKYFQRHYENYFDNIDYKVCKQQLDAIYEGKAKPIKIISKYNWYELGEKYTKFFLSVEKHWAIQAKYIHLL